jgi:hypothetical protein
MTAMLSELYGALKDAGASEDKARKAAEEVAAFNNRLTKLDTLARVTVGLLAALAAPNIVLWVKLGEVAEQVTALARKAAG